MALFGKLPKLCNNNRNASRIEPLQLTKRVNGSFQGVVPATSAAHCVLEPIYSSRLTYLQHNTPATGWNTRLDPFPRAHDTRIMSHMQQKIAVLLQSFPPIQQTASGRVDTPCADTESVVLINSFLANCVFHMQSTTERFEAAVLAITASNKIPCMTISQNGTGFDLSIWLGDEVLITEKLGNFDKIFKRLGLMLEVQATALLFCDIELKRAPMITSRNELGRNRTLVDISTDRFVIFDNRGRRWEFQDW
jgi:hypothetical protein